MVRDGTDELWRGCGLPDLHREQAERWLTHGDGRWGDTLDKLIGMVLRKRGLTVAERVEAGVLVGLLGIRGTGKTQLAGCLIRVALEAGMTARYEIAGETLLASRCGDAEAQARQLEQLTSCGLLVIDELHERADTDHERKFLTMVVDRRYGSGRTTLLVSNHHQAQFLETVGASVASRFEQAGRVVTCDWPSFRGRGTA